MLRRWIREYSSTGIEITRQPSALTGDRQRNRKLEAENKRLKMEREILKKGHGLLRERIELRFDFI